MCDNDMIQVKVSYNLLIRRHFWIFPRTTFPFSIKLDTKYPLLHGIQMSKPFFSSVKRQKQQSENSLKTFNNYFLLNYWANIDQFWNNGGSASSIYASSNTIATFNFLHLKWFVSSILDINRVDSGDPK